jgi:5'(3')-deoxyribonucleotidase
MLTVLLDLDGTVNEFDTAFIKRVRDFGYSFDSEGYKDWHIENFIRGADDPRKVMDHIFGEVEFWNNLQPKKGAKEVLKELNKKYDIKIVTYVWRREYKYIEAKKNWVNKYFHFLKNNDFILESEKWKVPGDIIIDDKPKVLDHCFGEKYTICCDVYNTEVKCNFRFKQWNQIPEIFKSIERERKRR